MEEIFQWHNQSNIYDLEDEGVFVPMNRYIMTMNLFKFFIQSIKLLYFYSEARSILLEHQELNIVLYRYILKSAADGAWVEKVNSTELGLEEFACFLLPTIFTK